MYRACQKGGSSVGRAKATIRSNAKRAAQQQVFRHNCSRAKSIAAAASSIGADGRSDRSRQQNASRGPLAQSPLFDIVISLLGYTLCHVGKLDAPHSGMLKRQGV